MKTKNFNKVVKCEDKIDKDTRKEIERLLQDVANHAGALRCALEDLHDIMYPESIELHFGEDPEQDYLDAYDIEDKAGEVNELENQFYDMLNED